MDAKTLLIVAMVTLTVVFLIRWFVVARARLAAGGHGSHETVQPTPLHLFIGAVTNFFDTLGIGSYATSHGDVPGLAAGARRADSRHPQRRSRAAHGGPGGDLHDHRPGRLHDTGPAAGGGRRRRVVRRRHRRRHAAPHRPGWPWARRCSWPPASCCCSCSGWCPAAGRRWG